VLQCVAANAKKSQSSGGQERERRSIYLPLANCRTSAIVCVCACERE